MTVTASDVALDVVALSGTIGAEIRGLDLRDLDDATVAAIRRVWLDRKVVFFPGQHLDPDAHLAFAARFGEPTEGHPVVPGIDGHPQVFEIDYSAARRLTDSYGEVSTPSRGISWHTDVTYVARPPLGSILRAVVVPPSGGDTLFSDQQAAFEGLSPALQDLLSGLTALHDGRPQFGGLLDRLGEGRWEGERLLSLAPVAHPVVRTHPETAPDPCSSTPASPPASASWSGPRATPCSPSCSPTRSGPNTPCATTGTRATWASGTTGPPSTRWRSPKSPERAYASCS